MMQYANMPKVLLRAFRTLPSGASPKPSMNMLGGTAGRDQYETRLATDLFVHKLTLRWEVTQAQFAARFAFSINTLRHWEQGKRQPEGPSRAYLQLIARTPRAVQRALRAAGSHS